jgi:hypothetical protein
VAGAVRQKHVDGAAQGVVGIRGDRRCGVGRHRAWVARGVGGLSVDAPK